MLAREEFSGKNIFLNQLAEKCMEKKKYLFVLLVYLENKYDGMSKRKLWNIHKEYELEITFLNCVMSFYDGYKHAWRLDMEVKANKYFEAKGGL